MMRVRRINLKLGCSIHQLPQFKGKSVTLTKPTWTDQWGLHSQQEPSAEPAVSMWKGTSPLFHFCKPDPRGNQLSLVQSLSHVRLFATLWTTTGQASLSITKSQSLLKLLSIELVIPSSHLILCHPLFLLPPIPPSIRVFSNESTLRMRWPKYWSFSFSIIPSKEIPGLISFRTDWLDLLTVQGTLKSLLQHHSSKASILRRSAFTVQPSHPYMTTGKTIALTRPTFVGKVMSLLFNMLSRLTITFLPRSKCLLISWLQSPSAVSLETPKIEEVNFLSSIIPIYCGISNNMDKITSQNYSWEKYCVYLEKDALLN